MALRFLYLLLPALIVAGGCAEKGDAVPASARRDTATTATGVAPERTPTPTALAEQARVMAERHLRTHLHVTGPIEMEGKPRDDGRWTVVRMKSEKGSWDVWVNPMSNETRDAVELPPTP